MHSKRKTTSSSSSLSIKEHPKTRNNLTNNNNNNNNGTTTKKSGGVIKYDADLILSDPYNIISEPSVICRKEGDTVDVVIDAASPVGIILYSDIIIIDISLIRFDSDYSDSDSNIM